ncbi:MAG: mechanosensitive ion channel family protein, partial [Sedimenticola sp.]|nr:mechanosensitive ion channel family protein [Sedimenticola sp.]
MWRSLLLLLILLFSFCQPVISQESVETAEEAKQRLAPPATLSSPRATIETFLHAMNDIKRGDPERINDAVTTLDLSGVNQLVRKERGRDLAWMLLEVMDRTRLVDTKRVPARTTGKPYLFSNYKSGTIQIVQMEDGRWLFGREGVDKLPLIMDELAAAKKVKEDENEKNYLPLHLRLREQIPERFKQRDFLLENWQWFGILFIILLGVVADKLISLFFRSLVRSWKSRTSSTEFKALSDQILRPLGLMAMAVIWWIGINLLGLGEESLLVLLVA